MKQRIALLVAVLLSLSLSLSCRPSPPAADAIARIGQDDILYSRFREYLEHNLGGEDIDVNATVQSRMLDGLLQEELLLRLAQDEGLITEHAAYRLAVEALLEREVPEVLPEALVRESYDANRTEFERPERLRLRQVLVEERAQADTALKALRDGTDFAEVAAEYSIDPSGPYGGDQGELARDDLPPDFVDAVFALEVGQISDVIATDYGFFIFQITDRKPAQHMSFEQVEPEIRRRLREQRLAEGLGRLVERAKGRYNVRLYEQNLPFDYRGPYREEPSPFPAAAPDSQP